MTQSDQESGALGRLAEWLSKPAYDTSPAMGPQLTRFGALVILSLFVMAGMVVIYVVP